MEQELTAKDINNLFYQLLWTKPSGGRFEVMKRKSMT